jgi:hypothetical protein
MSNKNHPLSYTAVDHSTRRRYTKTRRDAGIPGGCTSNPVALIESCFIIYDETLWCGVLTETGNIGLLWLFISLSHPVRRVEGHPLHD